MPSKLDHFFEEKLRSPDINDDMKYEFLRIKSFQHRTETEKGFAIRFAQAGFYYTGSGNNVKCFVCLREKDDWTDSDQPMKIHRNLNPYCAFLTREDNTNVPVDSQSVELGDIFNPITHLFESRLPSIPTELVGLSKQLSGPSDPEMNGPNENNVAASDPSMNTADRISNERNLAVRSTSEDAQFNAQETQTFSLSLEPSSSGHSSRENLASIAERSATSRPQAEVKPQELPKVDAGNLKYERHRLETYRTWPMGTPVTAKELAKNGFYYTLTGDRVQCVFCRGILKDWEVGDKPHIEHKNRFPKCPFILGTNVGNVPIPPPNPSNNMPPPDVGYLNNQSVSNMEALGINTERPKNPQYAIESSRIATFRNWPTYKAQTPEDLGSAGFFFAGFGDNVKCFYCDGGLRNWEVGDDPWIEHARWFPKCPFVLSVKGQGYIKNVQEAFKQGQSAPSRGEHIIEEREIKARLELPLVRTVLSTGVSKASVTKAIEKRLRETGDDFPSAEALLEAVLIMEAQPEELGVSTNTPGTSSGAPIPGTSSGEPNSLPGASNQSGPTYTSSNPEAGNQESGPKSNTPNELMTCKICMEKEVGIVFLPCGHLCCCVNCAPAVQQCPVCRTPIRGNVRTYIT